VRFDRVALAHSGALIVGWEAVSLRNEAEMSFGVLRMRAETHAPINEFRPSRTNAPSVLLSGLLVAMCQRELGFMECFFTSRPNARRSW
jgi:hypothetical protein